MRVLDAIESLMNHGIKIETVNIAIVNSSKNTGWEALDWSGPLERVQMQQLRLNIYSMTYRTTSRELCVQGNTIENGTSFEQMEAQFDNMKVDRR